MSNIVYNENSQKFLVLPDGDTATHKQIRDECESRYQDIHNKYEELIKGMVPRAEYEERIKQWVPKDKIERLIKLIDADIEYNKKSTPEAKIDPMSENTVYRQTTIVYAPEVIKKHLENLL